MQMYDSLRVMPILLGSSPHPKIKGKKKRQDYRMLKALNVSVAL